MNRMIFCINLATCTSPTLSVFFFTDGYLHLLQWTPREALSAPVSSAIYSCDGLLVYAGFCDGAVGVFDADSLRLRCRIAPSAYIPASVSRYASEILPRHFVFQTTDEH